MKHTHTPHKYMHTHRTYTHTGHHKYTHTTQTTTETTERSTATLPGSLKCPANDGAARDSEDDIFGGCIHKHYGVCRNGQHALHLHCTAHVLHLVQIESFYVQALWCICVFSSQNELAWGSLTKLSGHIPFLLLRLHYIY